MAAMAQAAQVAQADQVEAAVTRVQVLPVVEPALVVKVITAVHLIMEAVLLPAVVAEVQAQQVKMQGIFMVVTVVLV